MPTKVVKYKCNFCKRLFTFEWRAIWHEENRCTRNPAQMACLACNFFHAKPITDESYADTKVCCTNHQIPYQYNCDGWKEREAGYQFEVPFETKVNFQEYHSHIYDDHGEDLWLAQ